MTREVMCCTEEILTSKIHSNRAWKCFASLAHWESGEQQTVLVNEVNLFRAHCLDAVCAIASCEDSEDKSSKKTARL